MRSETFAAEQLSATAGLVDYLTVRRDQLLVRGLWRPHVLGGASATERARDRGPAGW